MATGVTAPLPTPPSTPPSSSNGRLADDFTRTKADPKARHSSTTTRHDTSRCKQYRPEIHQLIIARYIDFGPSNDLLTRCFNTAELQRRVHAAVKVLKSHKDRIDHGLQLLEIDMTNADEGNGLYEIPPAFPEEFRTNLRSYLRGKVAHLAEVIEDDGTIDDADASKKDAKNQYEYKLAIVERILERYIYFRCSRSDLLIQCISSAEQKRRFQTAVEILKRKVGELSEAQAKRGLKRLKADMMCANEFNKYCGVEGAFTEKFIDNMADYLDDAAKLEEITDENFIADEKFHDQNFIDRLLHLLVRPELDDGETANILKPTAKALEEVSGSDTQLHALMRSHFMRLVNKYYKKNVQLYHKGSSRHSDIHNGQVVANWRLKAKAIRLTEELYYSMSEAAMYAARWRKRNGYPPYKEDEIEKLERFMSGAGGKSAEPKDTRTVKQRKERNWLKPSSVQEHTIKDGGKTRNIEGWLTVPTGRQLAVRMNGSKEPQARCDLVAQSYYEIASEKYLASDESRDLTPESSATLPQRWPGEWKVLMIARQRSSLVHRKRQIRELVVFSCAMDVIRIYWLTDLQSKWAHDEVAKIRSLWKEKGGDPQLLDEVAERPPRRSKTRAPDA